MTAKELRNIARPATVCAVEPEKFADLVTVAGDSLADSNELERVRFVMKGGQVVKNELASH